MKQGDIVKYSNPTSGESGLRFVLLEHSGDRISIQLICDYMVKPIETVAIGEVCPVAQNRYVDFEMAIASQQAIQKQHPYGSLAHRTAYDAIRTLVKAYNGTDIGNY